MLKSISLYNLETSRIHFKMLELGGYSITHSFFFIWKSNDPTPRREILPNLIIWSFQVVFRAFHCFAASESKIVSHGFAQTSVIQLIKAGLMFSSNLKFIICSVNYIAGWVHHLCVIIKISIHLTAFFWKLHDMLGLLPKWNVMNKISYNVRYAYWYLDSGFSIFFFHKIHFTCISEL